MPVQLPCVPGLQTYTGSQQKERGRKNKEPRHILMHMHAYTGARLNERHEEESCYSCRSCQRSHIELRGPNGTWLITVRLSHVKLHDLRDASPQQRNPHTSCHNDHYTCNTYRLCSLHYNKCKNRDEHSNLI